MGVAVHALDEMRARSDRDHRLAMALLTKSRYTLPPLSEKDNSERTSGNRGAKQAPFCVSQPGHRPPLPSASRSASPRKRRVAVLAAYEALQGVNTTTAKRQRLTESQPSSSSTTTSSPGRDAISTSPQKLSKGIVRRSGSAGRRSQLGRPRSLQFALKDLSSADTTYFLKTLADLPHDIARLNATGGGGGGSSSREPTERLETTSTQVFGWRNCFLSPSTDSSTPLAGNVIWKARKTFETTAMKPLAAKVWDSAKTLSQQPLVATIRRWEQVYAVSESVRVVKRVDCLYGRDECETMWLECLIDRGDHLCIGRKQLVRFGDYELKEAATIGECEGFLFRPHLTKLKVDNEGSNSVEVDKPTRLMVGSTLQCVSSIAPRGLSTEQLLRNLIADLPQFTLQWEEAVVHDLLPQIKF